MNPATMFSALGPPPFVFRPEGGRVEGPAFSRVFQSLATVLVAGGIGWIWRLYQRDAITVGPGLLWVAAGLGLMLWTWVCVLRSRTAITGAVIEQRWIWDKRLPLADLAYCKLIRVTGLEWLIAPRVYVRTLSGKFLVFYGATPALVSEFSRLSRELAEFRRM